MGTRARKGGAPGAERKCGSGAAGRGKETWKRPDAEGKRGSGAAGRGKETRGRAGKKSPEKTRPGKDLFAANPGSRRVYSGSGSGLGVVLSTRV